MKKSCPTLKMLKPQVLVDQPHAKKPKVDSCIIWEDKEDTAETEPEV